MSEVLMARADSSGVFSLPSGYTGRKINQVKLDGRILTEEEYSFVDESSVDVFHSKEDSLVTAVIM